MDSVRGVRYENYACFFIDLLQPAAFLSYAFQDNDVDAVSVSLALAKTKKSLSNLQAKEADQLQTVKYYLQKVEEEEYQGIKIPGFQAAVNDLKRNSGRYISLLEGAIESRLEGTDDISAVASILNCEVWDSSSKETLNENVLNFLTSQAL